MLTSLHIKNFRGFRDLTIQPLARVNLIAGKNNVGKTGVLEAIHLLLSDTNQFFDFANAFRAGSRTPSQVLAGAENASDFQSFWMWLAQGKNWDSPIEIEMQDCAGKKLRVSSVTPKNNGAVEKVEFQFSDDEKPVAIKSRSSTGGGGAGSLPPEINWPRLAVIATKLSSPLDDAELFNQLNLIRGGRQKIVTLLKAIDQRLVDLQYIKVWQQHLVYAELTDLKESAPLTQLGQGFTRLVRLFAEMIIAEAKVVLIDEIENGIHHSALSQVWTGLAEIARQEDLQIFATTHSYECIRAAHETFGKSKTDDFAVHRLERDEKAGIRAITYDRESLDTSLELEWEVR